MDKVLSFLHFFLPVIVYIIGLLTYTPAKAEQSIIAKQENLPYVAKLLLTTLESCIHEKLTDESDIKYLGILVESAQKKIGEACMVGNKEQAYNIATRYAETPQGRAAMECMVQIQPIAYQPIVQKNLGKHRTTVNTLVRGKIPKNICL